MLDKKINVGIVDLGINNTQSIYNVYKKLGCNVKILTKKQSLLKFQLVILPGVGSFKSGIKKFKSLKIEKEIKRFLNKSQKNHLVGICLGMQLLFNESFEFGHTKGIGFIEGKVLPFDKKKCKKVPHMGWNSILIEKKRTFKKFSKKDFYFVHSFFCKPNNPNEIISYSRYNGFKFSSIIKKNNIIGLQFHPEKSGKDGIAILKSINKLL